MFREYYIVARYVASVPKDNDYTNFVLEQFARDIADTKDQDRVGFIKDLFAVLEGEEVDISEMDDDE